MSYGLYALFGVPDPFATGVWFTITSGTSIALEQSIPGAISDPFEGFTLPAGLLAITQAMPLGFVLSLLFLVLTTIFVATTGDSMSYVISTSMSEGDPSAMLRAFWGRAVG